MKRNRIITTILVACTSLLLAFGLTACGKKCEHTYDNACDAICNVCSETREVDAHTPNADDGDCTTEVKCSICGEVAIPAQAEHAPNADDGDCTTAITCSVCGTVTTEARTTHEGGAATCLKGKLCDFCGFEYDTTINPENHADKVYTDNGDDSHRVACQCGELFNEREWHSYAGIDLHTGKCACGIFVATISVTADGITAYYQDIEEAINAACSLDNSTVVLLESYESMYGNIEITSGNFTVELNGKRLDYWKSISGLAINGGNVVIKDSVGEGEVGYIKFHSGSLTLESGYFEYVCIVGELNNPADILADGYCFYDKDGNVVDLSTIELSNGKYYIYNVTVGEIQQN